MVGLLVQLKLTLLKNSLKRSIWRTVGLIFGMVYALGLVVAALIGLATLRLLSTALTADVTVLGFSILTLGWLGLSLLVYGVDETVDPSKFALLPVRARELLPGLLLAGLIGSPGVATVLVSLGLVWAWSRSLTLIATAALVVPIGVATCFLLSRAATAAFASFLSSRRFRDFAFVALALFGSFIGIAGNVVGGLASGGGGGWRQVLSVASVIAGWTPFGWVWSVPADVARGEWASAGIHLVLALALVTGLWLAWEHFLGLRLVEPVESGGEASKVKQSPIAERLYPLSPAGGVARRTLRYWRRDPRYLAGATALFIAPVILIVSQLLSPEGSPEIIAFTPVLMGMLVGISVSQDLSYDGTSLWLHISTGVSGAADRAGRAMSTMTIFVPLLVVLTVTAMVVSREWRLLAPVVGLTVGMALISAGVGSFVGALWQWPAPAPGGNPFQTGNNGGLPAMLSFGALTLGTLVLSLPTIALVVGSFWMSWLGWLALPVGVVGGVVVLRLGIRYGGGMLDRRWPEVMQAVSERTA